MQTDEIKNVGVIGRIVQAYKEHRQTLSEDDAAEIQRIITGAESKYKNKGMDKSVYEALHSGTYKFTQEDKEASALLKEIYLDELKRHPYYNQHWDLKLTESRLEKVYIVFSKKGELGINGHSNTHPATGNNYVWMRFETQRTLDEYMNTSNHELTHATDGIEKDFRGVVSIIREMEAAKVEGDLALANGRTDTRAAHYITLANQLDSILKFFGDSEYWSYARKLDERGLARRLNNALSALKYDENGFAKHFNNVQSVIKYDEYKALTTRLFDSEHYSKELEWTLEAIAKNPKMTQENPDYARIRRLFDLPANISKNPYIKALSKRLEEFYAGINGDFADKYNVSRNFENQLTVDLISRAEKLNTDIVNKQTQIVYSVALEECFPGLEKADITPALQSSLVAEKVKDAMKKVGFALNTDVLADWHVLNASMSSVLCGKFADVLP